MIHIENLVKNYGTFSLEINDFMIEKGKYHVFLGSTGAGKSLFIKILAGLKKPDSGRITVNNQDISLFLPEQRKMGYIPQEQNLFPHMNIMENILYSLKIKKIKAVEARNICMNIIEMLGIEHLLKRNPFSLSGGEKQKVALARALVTNPTALLLDEPLSAIDKAARFSFWKVLKQINKQKNLSVIHITHDHNEAYCLGDSISFMDQGKIIQTDRPKIIFRKPGFEILARFIGTDNIYSGEVFFKENKKFFKNNFFTFHIPDKYSVTLKNKKMIIDSEKVFISDEIEDKKNNFTVFVYEIQMLSSRFLKIIFSREKGVILDEGSKISMLMKHEDFEKSNLRVNMQLNIKVRPDAFHFLK